MAFRPIRGLTNPGGYPASEHQARHLHRNAEANGLGAAFTKAGGRVLVDLDRLQALLAEQASKAAAQDQQRKSGRR